MGENITFSDWSEKLENGTNHWLPAYGFQQPSNLQDRQFEILNDGSDTQQTFLFLETILEETSDDLRSDSDYSGPTGWPDSDSDTSSVIHIAEKLNATLRNTEWGGSERDLVVPKKRRRRQLLNSDPGVYDDDDDDDMDDDTCVPMSRSSSLLQFETLERQCETVFKTSATSEPFAMPTYNSNNYHWRFSSSDSLDDNRSTTDSSDDDLSRSYSSRSLKSNNSGLKSYRSFDSLTASHNSQADKNLGLLLSQSLSNNALYVEPESSEPIPTPRGIYKTVECLTEMSCQHSSKSQETVRAKRSVENLSEDSGFGDHTGTVYPTGEFGSFSLFSAETDKETTDSQRGDDINETEDADASSITATTETQHDEVKIEEEEEEGALSRRSWLSAGELLEEEVEDSQSESEIESELDHIPNMTSRVPVHSTPNLTRCDDEYLTDSDRIFYTDSVSCLSKTYSLKRINFESESDFHASRTSVCSGRSSRVQITTSFVNLSANTFDNGANHNNNKVHSSPVVSKVKWDSTANRENLAKDYYSPSCVDAMVKKLFDCEEEEKEGHMDIKCVNADANEDSVDSRPSCYTMESYQRAVDRDEIKSPKHLGKFGEFFQRFSFKRLSGRSSHSKRKDEKKIVASKKPSENSMNVISAEDTKIIPSKPPLPPSSRRRPSPVFPQCQVSSSMSAECGDRDGILETDLDSEITTKKAQSLLNLDDDRKPKSKKHPASTLTPHADHRAKSMEFLLDKENKEAVKPPENELRRDRVPSEHELRVQRSLQRLDLPEWYRNHPSLPAQGFLLGKRHSDAGRHADVTSGANAAPCTHQTSQHHHWPGLSSKTTSLSSLGSSAAYSTSSAPRNSPERGSVSTSAAPPLFTRWSTSKLNHSTATSSSSSSPVASARSSFNARAPYLGWRYSHERLAKPNTPNERLAASILRDSATTNSQDNEVRTSIKEVTSAIVHYVSAREQGSADKLHASSRYLHDSSSPSRSISPKGSTGKVEKCWLESSFIGCRPIEIPPSSPVNNPPMPPDYFLNLNNSFTSTSKSVKVCPNTNGELSST